MTIKTFDSELGRILRLGEKGYGVMAQIEMIKTLISKYAPKEVNYGKEECIRDAYKDGKQQGHNFCLSQVKERLLGGKV